jgi:hypothetical protein
VTQTGSQVRMNTISLRSILSSNTARNSPLPLRVARFTYHDGRQLSRFPPLCPDLSTNAADSAYGGASKLRHLELRRKHATYERRVLVYDVRRATTL